MRELVEIPQGDLFTTMEAWEDPGRIAKAMETILDLEKEALSTLQAMPGLTELLRYLKVTRSESSSLFAPRCYAQSLSRLHVLRSEHF